MRSATQKNLVVSNEAGKGFKRGMSAVVRPYRGEPQQILNFYSGCKRNVRNNKGSCLDVSGGKNENNQPVTFWKCHDGDNQAWVISQLKIVKVQEKESSDGKFPVKDGKKFMIRNEMPTHKMLYAAEKLDANQRVLRIITFNAKVKTAYWVFDSRTSTIRSAFKRDMVLTNK